MHSTGNQILGDQILGDQILGDQILEEQKSMGSPNSLPLKSAALLQLWIGHGAGRNGARFSFL